MPNNVSAFAINADEVPRARKFYEAVFGWSFEPWGPPDFYLIETGKEQITPVRGLLQERRELAPGHTMVGFMHDQRGKHRPDDSRHRAHGGRIAAPKFHIPTVGTVAYFFDTEGNVAGIIQEEERA